MKTNRLVYIERKKTPYDSMEAKIKLADDCNNGHVVFSLTATGYDKKIERHSGAMHMNMY